MHFLSGENLDRKEPGTSSCDRALILLKLGQSLQVLEHENAEHPLGDKTKDTKPKLDAKEIYEYGQDVLRSLVKLMLLNLCQCMKV